MDFPAQTPSAANVDQGTDSPAAARTDLNTLISLVTQIIQSYAAANGICDLDANGYVPAARLAGGSGTGNDSDLLDGQHGSFYQNAANLIAGTLPGARFADSSHGNRSGGAHHAVATQVLAGFMSAADKVVLDVLNASGVISQGRLKTAVGAVSLYTGTYHTTTDPDTYGYTGSGNLTLPGGTYGFYPQFKTVGGSPSVVDAQLCAAPPGLAYLTMLSMSLSTPSSPTAVGALPYRFTAYAQQRYISASPPYPLAGRDDWGHFLFVLRRISDGELVAAYEAQDPPWAYNGHPTEQKSSLAIGAMPHPFSDYHERDPAADGLEIVLVDLAGMRVEDWLQDTGNKATSTILEDLSPVQDKRVLITAAEAGVVDIERFAQQVKILRS